MTAAAPASVAADDGGGVRTGLAVYVHWPFCLSKCPYCDFNSHVQASVDHARWRRALTTELDHFADITAGRTVTSIFFGGGTPSLMDPATVAALIDRAAARWALAPDVEITLEANPTSVEAGRLAGFAAAGVNRVSLGVQALDADALRFLGRGHDVDEALDAVALAARLFDRYSFDLIYARPGQTVAAWRAELGRALERARDHLSVYQLTIEPGTAFHALFARGAAALPEDEVCAALYEETQAMLAAAGLPAYEVSNHARPGGESRHNLAYWRYADYVGIGPGAHGRLTLAGTKWATRCHRAPAVWLDRVERDGHAEGARAAVDPASRAAECLMMGLRLAEGVPLARLSDESGRPWQDMVDEDAAHRLAAGGFLSLDGSTIRATPAGRQVLDSVLATLLI
ncbi:MAG: radical SAM family heme chaperone HemW [Inquilinaceae bacterium]